MKNIVLILFTISFFTASAQDRLDKVANAICEKLSAKDLSGITNMEELTEELGLVMVDVIAKLNKKELKKLGVENLDVQSYEKLGEMVGGRLGATCEPFSKLILKLMSQEDSELLEAIKEEEGIKSNKKFGTATGKVIAINQTDFLSITIEDEDDNKNKYYFFKAFDGADQFLEKLDSINNRNVEIDFMKYKVYDPSSKSYRNIKEIKSIAFE